MKRWGLALVALSFGGLIYAWNRPQAIALLAPSGLRPHSLSPLIANLPDMLWAFALAVVVSAIWRNGPRASRCRWHAVSLVFALSMELMQWLGVVRGTFDLHDLSGTVIGYALGVAIAGSNFGDERVVRSEPSFRSRGT
jgi:hypothetical protein